MSSPLPFASPKRAPNNEADIAAARRVLEFAGEALTALAGSLGENFSRALDILLAVNGRVVVSGMGKSGHVGQKIAATLSSTGTPAQFVHPAEASHGDLGALTREDALLMLSNSGETAELSSLTTYAKRFEIPLIGIASNPDSALLQAANVALQLPNAREACPIGLAPTTSTTIMLALGDALAVALMERRGFSVDQYRELHPAGALGRALIRVDDIMHKGDELPLVAPDTLLSEVMMTMTSNCFGFAGVAGVVDKSGLLLGIITDGDLRRHMSSDLLERQASQVMTKNPKTVVVSALAAEAVAVMNNSAPRVTSLFVVDGPDGTAKPVGFLTIHDCLRAGVR
jgi:arabinose-5-phosphate isomerase